MIGHTSTCGTKLFPQGNLCHYTSQPVILQERKAASGQRDREDGDDDDDGRFRDLTKSGKQRKTGNERRLEMRKKAENWYPGPRRCRARSCTTRARGGRLLNQIDGASMDPRCAGMRFKNRQEFVMEEAEMVVEFLDVMFPGTISAFEVSIDVYKSACIFDRPTCDCRSQVKTRAIFAKSNHSDKDTSLLHKWERLCLTCVRSCHGIWLEFMNQCVFFRHRVLANGDDHKCTYGFYRPTCVCCLSGRSFYRPTCTKHRPTCNMYLIVQGIRTDGGDQAAPKQDEARDEDRRGRA